MTTFEIIKERVTVPQAAAYYGIISRNGMCSCFEHTDKHPSMKLYEKNYHCFGCGAHGDVIALVANILGISMIEAAKRINADFGLGLDMDKPVSRNDIIMIHRKRQEEQDYAEWENHAFNVLSEYHKLLIDWRNNSPESSDDIPDKHFVESVNTLDYCEYIFDSFLNGNKGERLMMKREVECFEQRIYSYRRECITCVAGGKGKDKRTAVL